MARISKTTRDASGLEFQIEFEDNGNPTGPLLPVSQIDGTVIVDLAPGAEVVASFDGELPAGSQTIGGVEIRNTPAVVDGTAAFVFTAASGTSTGSAIAALTANPNRKAFQFQNASDTDFTVNFDGTASASAGFLVAPGKLLEFYGAACPKGAVSLFCGAASKRYVLRTA